MTDIDTYLAYVPDWAVGVALLAFAVAVAWLFMLAIDKVLSRWAGAHSTVVHSIFTSIRRPLRLAVTLLATSFAAQLPYLPKDISLATTKVLTVGAILLVGWGAITALDIASQFYLRRFKVDSADNLLARKHVTQTRILRRALDVLIGVITIAAALMAFEPVRQFGVSLFASAGAAGLIVGLAARPLLSSLIAGIQLAITQPIRMGDAVIVENEWGTVEEITATYVVIKIWDWRRLIVPLSYFMEKPFQNWTRETANLIGVVYVQVDYAVPVDKVRAKLDDIVNASKLWDKQVVNLQVTDFKESTVEIRILVSARSSGEAWDLRCEVREKLLAFLQQECGDALPRRRVELPALSSPAQLDGLHESAVERGLSARQR